MADAQSGDAERAVEGPDKQPKGDGGADSPLHPGMAPARGERLESDSQSQRAEQPRADDGPGRDHGLREGVVYSTPDGEERLVWVVRNGVAEYFARRPGERWRATLDRGLVTVDEFARQVGRGAP